MTLDSVLVVRYVYYVFLLVALFSPNMLKCFFHLAGSFSVNVGIEGAHVPHVYGRSTLIWNSLKTDWSNLTAITLKSMCIVTYI